MNEIIEYLQQIRTSKVRLDHLKQEEQDLRELATRIAPIMSETGGGGGGYRDRIGDTVQKIVDVQFEIADEIRECTRLRRRIERQIGKLKKAEQQEVLHKRYVLMQDWQTIADSMNYTYAGTVKLHGRALVEFQRIVEREGGIGNA